MKTTYYICGHGFVAEKKGGTLTHRFTLTFQHLSEKTSLGPGNIFN